MSTVPALGADAPAPPSARTCSRGVGVLEWASQFSEVTLQGGVLGAALQGGGGGGEGSGGGFGLATTALSRTTTSLAVLEAMERESPTACAVSSSA